MFWIDLLLYKWLVVIIWAEARFKSNFTPELKLVNRVYYAIQLTFALDGIGNEELCLGVGLGAFYACRGLVSLGIEHSMNQVQRR